MPGSAASKMLEMGLWLEPMFTSGGCMRPDASRHPAVKLLAAPPPAALPATAVSCRLRSWALPLIPEEYTKATHGLHVIDTSSIDDSEWALAEDLFDFDPGQ